ncbi:terpene synthase family protein [Streptomyces roseoverticillatus]|uniref:terpene synthase family protein n=1 Tax=Streptomyces roseoverticillatus TaxID=66429 RepID=UPI0004BECF3D|nr:hypothetical protein [Streptomyces roseoverticillatus]
MTAPVPELYCPIPSAVSDWADALNEHAAAWMADNHLYANSAKLAQYQASKFGTFAARTCPHPGIALDLMKLYTEWLAFGFFYDDQFMDESAAANGPATVAEAVIAIVSTFTPPGGTGGAPVYAHTDTEHRLPVMHSLLERTAVVARPEQFDRLCTHMVLWSYSYLYEALTLVSGRPMRLAGFCANRMYNIASLPYVTLAQIVAGCSATAEDLAHPDAVLMGCLAAYQMGWCNDIHSADHETRVNPGITHLPGLIAAQGKDPRTAMAEAAHIHDTTMRSYLDAEQRVLATGRAGLIDYARVLRAWVRGHYDWCRATRRYNAPLAHRRP